MNCKDAISLGDGRELFVVEISFSITSYMDNYCLCLKNGQAAIGAELELISCAEADRHDDNR